VSDLLEEIESPHPAADMGVPQTIVLMLGPDDQATLAQVSVLMKLDPVRAMMQLLRNARPSPNGQGYEVICSGCGLTYQSDRRPLPGKKRWCENCRKTGEPGADRARRYRDRKAANQGAK
jgi:hypothetical protein